MEIRHFATYMGDKEAVKRGVCGRRRGSRSHIRCAWCKWSLSKVPGCTADMVPSTSISCEHHTPVTRDSDVEMRTPSLVPDLAAAGTLPPSEDKDTLSNNNEDGCGSRSWDNYAESVHPKLIGPLGRSPRNKPIASSHCISFDAAIYNNPKTHWRWFLRDFFGDFTGIFAGGTNKLGGRVAVLMALMGSVGRERLATSPPDFDGSDGGLMGLRVLRPPLATFGGERELFEW
ncbi:hypothetical protein B0H14DRAFT_2639443 [Mycena olivaceomarginata]|nr:hypothetical protein B0H14DRAFT_2639443 [Mycena olivaceomarginata]